jgi:hypothetical protein
MVTDLPDYTRFVTISVEVPPTQQAPVIPRPMGGSKDEGSVTTTANYQEVAAITPGKGYTLQLAKSLVSCDQDVMYKLQWNALDIGPEVLVAAKTPTPDWYPWGYEVMEGDGALKLALLAKYPSGGSAGTCFGELVGEEYITV